MAGRHSIWHLAVVEGKEWKRSAFAWQPSSFSSYPSHMQADLALLLPLMFQTTFNMGWVCFIHLLFWITAISQLHNIQFSFVLFNYESSALIRLKVLEEKANVEEACEGMDEEECLMRRTLAAHTDYIYTQKQNPWNPLLVLSWNTGCVTPVVILRTSSSFYMSPFTFKELVQPSSFHF